MRFILGIFTGAGLTLLVATATDAPTSPVIHQLSGIWQTLISVTADRLFRHSAADEVTQPELERMVQRQQQPPIAPADAALSASEHLVAEEPEALSTTLPEQSGPGEIVETAETLLESPAPTPTSTPASTPAPTSTSPPMIEPQVQQAGAAIAAIQRAPAGDQLAAVWVPFHSERSATGFARSLSRQFDYPFSVRRAGPGAYQVIFPYASTDQRENMLMEIAELTGQ